jgi:hypothetical protein
MALTYPRRCLSSGCVSWLTRSYPRGRTTTTSRSQMTRKHAVPQSSESRRLTVALFCSSSAS